MTVSMAAGIIWSLLTAGICVGWGRLAQRIFSLGPPAERGPPHAVLGLAMVLGLAAMANALRGVGWMFFVVVYATGAVMAVRGFLHDWSRERLRWREWCSSGALSAGAVILVWLAYAHRPFNAHDDYYAYLVQPI